MGPILVLLLLSCLFFFSFASGPCRLAFWGLVWQRGLGATLGIAPFWLPAALFRALFGVAKNEFAPACDMMALNNKDVYRSDELGRRLVAAAGDCFRTAAVYEFLVQHFAFFQAQPECARMLVAAKGQVPVLRDEAARSSQAGSEGHERLLLALQVFEGLANEL